MNPPKLIHKRSAFTLIELLIVIAIMSILAAGTIAYITVPPQEERRATVDMEQEAGLGAFFAKVTGDAHNAARLTPAPNKRGLILEETGKETSTVYFVDQKDCLRRSVMTRARVEEWRKGGNDRINPIDSARLATNVSSLDVTAIEGGKLWRVFVSMTTGDPQRPAMERGIQLAVGPGHEAARTAAKR